MKSLQAILSGRPCRLVSDLDAPCSAKTDQCPVRPSGPNCRELRSQPHGSSTGGFGQLRPFAVVAEISSERPFTPARRSSGGGEAAAAAPGRRSDPAAPVASGSARLCRRGLVCGGYAGHQPHRLRRCPGRSPGPCRPGAGGIRRHLRNPRDRQRRLRSAVSGAVDGESVGYRQFPIRSNGAQKNGCANCGSRITSSWASRSDSRVSVFLPRFW